MLPFTDNQIGNDITFAFANNDVANTQKVATLDKLKGIEPNHCISVYNPSTVTDLTLKIFMVEPALGGADRDGLIAKVNIPKAQTITGTVINTYSTIVYGFVNASEFKFVLSNDTALGAADGFSAYLRVREVAEED